ncbi:hypothetical protein IOC61_03290 [Halomonas sp. KAO]|uniref:hypothetical protein n=1 Tax=Halomonas sp. KAO TaxID=2783858 RepID=UPI0018A0DBD5|nr:hypothetical protein [Halomonas sp. KAO]MBF7052340.1 hypothetical protein [Halomonas sp. KAO]
MRNESKFHLNRDVTLFVGKVFVKYHFKDFTRPLIITFSPDGVGLLSKEKIASGVSPWGFSYIKKIGYNVISFAELAENRSYYRDKSFRERIFDFSRSLPDFSERIGYGGSMGGYGVSAYSNVLGISRMLLFNPISTRNRAVATWDWEKKRSLDSFKFDWGGDYSDGAESNASGFVVYDPLYQCDKLHAIRYSRLVKLKFPGVGHGVSEFLNQMGELDWLVKSFLNNELDSRNFFKKIRKRRRIERYYSWMLSNENEYLTPNRRNVIEKFRDFYFSSPRRGMKGFVKLSVKDVDVIRDAALLIENSDADLSHQLLLVAKKARPNGVLINKKLNQYKTKYGV